MLHGFGNAAHVMRQTRVFGRLEHRLPLLVTIVLHPMVTILAFCVAGVLATMLFETVSAFLVAAALCKLFTIVEKNAALDDFQRVKGIGNGLVSRAEIAEVAICADDGVYRALARMDMLATALVVISLLIMLI